MVFQENDSTCFRMWCKELLICSLVVLLSNNIQAKRPIKKVLELVKEIRYDMVDEIVEALAPLLNNCCGDDDGGDGQQGMYIREGLSTIPKISRFKLLNTFACPGFTKVMLKVTNKV